MVAVVVALVRYAYREPVGSAGIAGQNWRRHVALGLAAAVIAIPVSDLLERLCVLGAALSLPPATHDALLAFQQFTSVHKQLIEPLHTPSGLVALLVVAGIIGPFAEEVFFRGLAHTALRHRLGPLWGSVASAAFFALIHVSPLSLIPIFVMGLVLAAVYERTGTLAAPFALHALNNTVAVLLVYFQPDFTFWPFIPVR
jgi:membrane protease YdiL (CAAX protease family)